jgi:O-antigen/teichoic acid export membrane protein
MPTNTQRIAKNTLMLYFRQILIMLVSLYTVRVVLDTLGAEDYGIYNVVAGVVTMLSFLSGTMASAAQRFFAYEIGQNNIKHLREMFSLVVVTYVFISIVIFALGETVGLWFIETKLTIQYSRIIAAKWVFNCSLFSFIASVLSTPYQALIIAHEKMDIYAFVSLGETISKLLIVYLLLIISFDKLKLYGILVCFATILTTCTYRLYCRKKFKESKYLFYWNINEFKEILTFAWWNMIGSLANILSNQGINILLNIFFSPVVNAARAVAHQVNSALTTFSHNFYMAVRPQIVKYYSVGKLNEMNNLVIKSSKFSFYLIMLFSIPFLLETEHILGIWLKIIPDYTIVFTRLIVINTLIDIFNHPLVSVIQATGKIKFYQLIISVAILSNFPIAYIFLRFGYSPEATMVISIIISLVCFMPRLYFAKLFGAISIRFFLKNVLLVAGNVCILSTIVPVILTFILKPSVLRIVLIMASDVLLGTFIIYYIGMTKSEKLFVNTAFKRIFWKEK